MKRILIIVAAVMIGAAASPAAAAEQDDPIWQTYEAGDGPDEATARCYYTPLQYVGAYGVEREL